MLIRLPIRQNQKKARPAKGLRPSLAKATAGSMNMKKGTRHRNNRNMASEIGRKYIIFFARIISDNYFAVLVIHTGSQSPDKRF
jgi:hypothetical protein